MKQQLCFIQNSPPLPQIPSCPLFGFLAIFLERSPITALNRRYALALAQCCSQCATKHISGGGMVLDWYKQQRQRSGVIVSVSSAGLVLVKRQQHSVSTGPHQGQSRGVLGT